VVVFVVAAVAVVAWLAGSDADEPLTARFAAFLMPVATLLAAAFVAAALGGRLPRLATALAFVAVVSWLALVGLGKARLAAADYTASFLRSPRDEAGGFINHSLAARAPILVPASPGPYEMPVFDFSRFRLVTDRCQPHDYVVQVEETAALVAPTGYQLAGSFAASARGETTPLSFSGRSVGVYRHTQSDTR
jgi:hypothetical protein